MIEVKNPEDEFYLCNSCGSDNDVLKIEIRRGKSVNAFCLYLCKKCIKVLTEELQKKIKGDIL